MRQALLHSSLLQYTQTSTRVNLDGVKANSVSGAVPRPYPLIRVVKGYARPGPRPSRAVSLEADSGREPCRAVPESCGRLEHLVLYPSMVFVAVWPRPQDLSWSWGHDRATRWSGHGPKTWPLPLPWVCSAMAPRWSWSHGPKTMTVCRGLGMHDPTG